MQKLCLEGEKNTKKLLSGIVLTLLLIGMLTSAFNIQPVKAEPKIWIVDDDGSADFRTIQEAVNAANPSDTIIVREGAYTENVNVNKDHLTIKSESGVEVTSVQAANPNDHVFEVTADNVTIKGFTVKGATGTEAYLAGIYVGGTYSDYVEHCNIFNNRVFENRHGIVLRYSSNTIVSTNVVNSNNWNGILLCSDSTKNLVTDNAASSQRRGVFLCGGSIDNTVKNNNLSSNGYGIELEGSPSNILSANNVFNNEYGISLRDSSSNSMNNNEIHGNKYNFFIDGDSLEDFTQDIDTSNVVDNKPIYYLINEHDKWVPSGAGFVGAINCANITVKGSTLTKNYFGVVFAYTNDSKVENVNVLDNCIGIWLFNSNSNTLKSNNISNIDLNIILDSSNTNNIYFNDFTYLGRIFSYNSINAWNSPNKITYTYEGKTFTNYLGNYWSDYAGSDADGDGIGDAPYRVEEDKDNYPLMKPFGNYLEPPEAYDYTVSISGLGSGYLTNVYLDGIQKATLQSGQSHTFSGLTGSHSISVNSVVNDEAGTRYKCSQNSITISSQGAHTFSYRTQYYLTMGVNPQDSGTVSPSSDWYDAGFQVQISAFPSAGYSFKNWVGSGSGSYSGTSKSVTITMNGPITENANFEPVTTEYKVTVQITGLVSGVTTTVYIDGSNKGQLSSDTYSFNVPAGSHTFSVDQYVPPNPSGTRYHCPSSSQTASSATTITFAYHTEYYLTVNTAPSGLVLISGSDWYDAGTTATTAIAPDKVTLSETTYAFSTWKVDGSSVSDNPISIVMDSPHTATAYYRALPPSLEYGDLQVVVKDESNNLIGGASLISTSQPSGQAQLSDTTGLDGRCTWQNVLTGFYTIQASKSGYTSNSGSGTVNSGQTTTITITLTHSVELFTVTFDASPRNSSIIIDDVTYSASQLPKSFDWEKGSSHSFSIPSTTVSAGSGTRYVFTQWNDGSTSTSRTISVTNSVSFTAQFKTQCYLTVNSDPSGIAIISGSGWYDANTFATTGNAPETIISSRIAYKFSTWKVDGTYVSGNPISVFMGSPHTATACYKESPVESVNYTVSLSSKTTDGQINVGSITFDGVGYALPRGLLKQTGSYTATANPPSGYSFKSWETIEDVTVSSTKSQTTSVTVKGDGTLRAVFEPVPPQINPPSVSTYDATNVGSTTATLNGYLDDTGGETCQVWFEYGVSTSYEYSTMKQLKSSRGLFSVSITDLSSGINYHFRACASNSKGYSYGPDMTFMTITEIYNTAFITDEEFTDAGSLTLTQIRELLVSQNSPLAGTITDVDGLNIDSALLIYNAAQTYRISPKVLIAIAEKETTAITGFQWQPSYLKKVMGYPTNLAGTARDQIEKAAWQFRSYLDDLEKSSQTMSGWKVGVAKLTQDGVWVTPANKAVAALFTYTPLAGVQWGGNQPQWGGNFLFYDAWYNKFHFFEHQINPTLEIANLKELERAELCDIIEEVLKSMQIQGRGETAFFDQAHKLLDQFKNNQQPHDLVREGALSKKVDFWLVKVGGTVASIATTLITGGLVSLPPGTAEALKDWGFTIGELIELKDVGFGKIKDPSIGELEIIHCRKDNEVWVNIYLESSKNSVAMLIPVTFELPLEISWINCMSTDPFYISEVGVLKPRIKDAKIVGLDSPGELRVYDSEERLTGLMRGEVKEEIPNSMYDKKGNTVIIFYPAGSYRYEVVGTGEGTYGLEVTSVENGKASTLTLTNVPTSTSSVHQYTVDWDTLSQGEKGVNMQIDSDGDGTFEKTVEMPVLEEEVKEEIIAPPIRIILPDLVIGETPQDLPDSIKIAEKMEIRLMKVMPETPVELKVENSTFSRIWIGLNESCTNVKVMIEKLGEKPSELSAPPGVVWAYYRIEVNVLENALEKVEMGFWVSKEWLATHGVSKDNIRLLRFKEGDWRELATEVVGENSTHFSYMARTNGLSVFAIIAYVPPGEVPLLMNTILVAGVLIAVVVFIAAFRWKAKKSLGKRFWML